MLLFELCVLLCALRLLLLCGLSVLLCGLSVLLFELCVCRSRVTCVCCAVFVWEYDPCVCPIAGLTLRQPKEARGRRPGAASFGWRSLAGRRSVGPRRAAGGKK